MNTTATATSPESLRNAMITKVKDAGYALSLDVERALRSVERHVFVPGVAVEQAYANDIVVTKRGPDDQVLSCLSQPSIVALQLGQLGVQPGHRVLEIGAGAGYNAAVLAHLAGPDGHVTAVDVDADIVEQARDRLATAGAENAAVDLTDRVAEEIRTWSAHHRDRTVQFEIPPIGTDVSHPTVGRYGLDRPHHAITVIWR